MGVRTYALEQLYQDQHPDLVIDAIPAAIAWLARAKRVPPCGFRLIIEDDVEDALRFSWDVRLLALHDPHLEARVSRLARGTTGQREHVTELAAYALALCAMSILLPGQRAVGWSRWAAPDILLDDTPGALRGVEVAGRSRGGVAALNLILEGDAKTPGKRHLLAAHADLVEAYVSLWCATPSTSVWAQVKP